MENIEIKVTDLNGENINNILNNQGLDSINYTIFNIDGSNFKGNNLYNCFNGFKYLKQINNIESIDINNINNVGRMFTDCSNLEGTWNLSNWDFNNIYVSDIFGNCGNNLNIIYNSDKIISGKTYKNLRSLSTGKGISLYVLDTQIESNYKDYKWVFGYRLDFKPICNNCGSMNYGNTNIMYSSQYGQIIKRICNNCGGEVFYGYQPYFK